MQYVKIKDTIVEQIEAGMLSPRQKLPPERKLAEMFDTTRVTLREALSLLESEGRIYREDRRGWFISPMPLRYDPTQPHGFVRVAKMQNRSPQSQLVVAKSVLANKEAARLLSLGPFSDVFQIERIRYLEERPIAYIVNYAQPERFPKLLTHDLSASVTDVYMEQYGVSYKKTHYKISMTSLLGDVAQALRATPGAPAMVVERTNYDENEQVIDASIELWRHDAISIESLVDLGL